MKDQNPVRPYRMTRRAEQTRQTRERIVEAFRAALFDEGTWFDEITLRGVAERAEVTEQTVIRHFGGKEGLLDGMLAVLTPLIEQGRAAAPEGDLDAAIHQLVEEYERMGAGTLRALALEERFDVVRRALDVGRASHRRWCTRTFAPWLPAEGHPDNPRRLSLFAAATDVTTWKIHRRDSGLDREQTRLAMTEQVRALAAQAESAVHQGEIP